MVITGTVLRYIAGNSLNFIQMFILSQVTKIKRGNEIYGKSWEITPNILFTTKKLKNYKLDNSKGKLSPLLLLYKDHHYFKFCRGGPFNFK